MSTTVGFFVGLPLGILVGALFIVLFVKRKGRAVRIFIDMDV